nr:hypothetical protein [Tanacetum cinerariifolium]
MHWFPSVMVWVAMTGVFKQLRNLPTMPSWHSSLQVLLTMRDNALVVLRQNLEKAEQERDDMKLKLEKFQTSCKNLNQLLAIQTNDKTRYQSGDGYHAVPPPYTGTFMPPKSDLVFHNSPDINETAHTAFNVALSPTKPDNDFFVQPTEQVKSHRPSLQHVETSIPTTNPKMAIPKPTSNGICRKRKACFVCKSLDHLIKDCDFYEKTMAQTFVRNHAHKGNNQQYARMPLPNPQRHMVPTTVITQSKLVPINAARPVTTVVPKPHVTRPRLAKAIVTKPHSPPRRHINRSLSPKANNFPPKVTAVKVPQVNAAKGVQGKWE